jgi:aminopeptidase-like protein
MNVRELAAELRPDELAPSMLDLLRELFPICRSITGAGLRETLARVDKLAPLMLTEVPSGTEVFDWTIPREWNIRDAWVAGPSGRRVIDFQESNLRVVNYSVPVRKRMTLDELRPHLHTVPDHPTWVPYRTTYYAEQWGFCVSEHELQQLPTGELEVVIDSTLEDGSLTYGECFLPGTTDDEVLVSAHICHPSLANDNLSGVVVAATLASILASTEHRLSYRFVFAPGTIGAVAWLAGHEAEVSRIVAGLVLACVGDSTDLVYKRSRRGNTHMDRVAAHVLRHRAPGDHDIPFSPYGNDERQYCSPGFDLPVGALNRAGHDRSERHHTSADDIASISGESLADTVLACIEMLAVLDDDGVAINLRPKGEPQLGRRGLFRTFGGRTNRAALESALLWVLSSGDGRASLLDVADQAGLPFSVVRDAAAALEAVQLVRQEPCPSEGAAPR